MEPYHNVVGENSLRSLRGEGRRITIKNHNQSIAPLLLLPLNAAYLLRSTSFQRQIDPVAQITLAARLARAVAIVVGVRLTVERFVKLKLHLHEAGGTVQCRFRSIQEDDRAQIVQFRNLRGGGENA